MALNYVTLTLDLYDGRGNLLSLGTVTFTPNAQLTDTTDNQIVTQAPVTVPLASAVALPITVKLLATDNANISPPGWGWTATFTGVPGSPAAFSFFLAFSGGSNQNLSHLSPLNPLPPLTLTVTGTPGLGYLIRSTSATSAVWVPGIVDLVADYGVSRSNTAAQNTTAIQQAFTDVTTGSNPRCGYAIWLKGAPMFYPCNTLTLPSEPLTFFGDGPTQSVLGTTSGTILTCTPSVAPLQGASDPFSQNNSALTSGVHYKTLAWEIHHLGFTKIDNWSGNTGDGWSFSTNWSVSPGLVMHAEDILVSNFNGAGINFTLNGTRGESRFIGVTADGCADVGMILGSDLICTNIQGNNCGHEGILINGKNTVVTGGKCYSNGAGHVAGRGSGVSIIGGNGATVVTDMYTQDNDGPGATISGGQNIVLEIEADRNCWNNSVTDTTKQAGVAILGGFGCQVKVMATDTFTGTKPNPQAHAVQITNPSSTNAKNLVVATQTQTTGGGTTGTTVDLVNSVLDGCTMVVDGVTLKRVKAVSAPGATPAVNTDMFDVYHFTGLAAAITSMTTSLTGTPVDGQELRLSFTDNGTARAITWGASFESSTVTLPSTTVISARLDVRFHWNTETSKWRCVQVA